jgi:thioredoxin 1
MEIGRVDGEGLDAVVSSARGPLLVYFEAEGCAASDLGRSVLQELPTFEGRLEVVRCDVWDAPAVVARLRLLSLPSCVVFVDGKEITRLAGVPRRRRLAALIGEGLRAADAFETAAGRRSA